MAHLRAVDLTDARHPITLQPRLETKPWGGQRLADCGIALPEGGVIGEALLTAPEATVSAGPAMGKTLGELAAADPERWVGEHGLAVTGGLPIFPLLVKLIDADADLSIQVHPDDRAAAAAGLGTGKTEAWHILAARPGGVLYAGLERETSALDFQRACRQGDGSAAGHLRQLLASAGMTVVIPAGTPHAIGSGMLLYEIQQPSNITFRLDDWGRRDRSGQSRALHHQEGFAALDSRSRPEAIERVVLSSGESRRELLAATRYFALERIALVGGREAPLPPLASPRVLTCTRGAATLHAGRDATPMSAGATVVVPAGCPAVLQGVQDAVILLGWVPDLEREVIAPARAAGAAEDSIAQLGIAIGE